MKILIVEDNAPMRTVIKVLVESWGHTAKYCDNGKKAIEMYLRHKPNCVLMDIEMKAMDGFTATRRIRQMDPEAKIIIVTQYDDNESRDEAREAGAVDFVSKENLLGIKAAIKKLETRNAR